MNKIFTLKNAKKLLLVSIGSIMSGFATHAFLNASNLAVGGATGMSLLISSVTGIPMSYILLAANILFLGAGFIFIGMSFGFLTIYSTFLLGFTITVCEKILPMNTPLSTDTMLMLIIGIILNASGIAIVLHQGASTGGSDIIGKLVEKYTPLSFGQGLFSFDILVTIGAMFIFGPAEGLYSSLGVFMGSNIIDFILAGLNRKFLITITSNDINPINEYIIGTLKRGCTLYTAQGGYTKNQRHILTTILNRNEYIKLSNYVKKNDEKAFMYINQINEIHGEGFTYALKND